MKKILLVLLLAANCLVAQNDSLRQLSPVTPHSIGAKVLFVDYNFSNSQDKTFKITNGLEFVYLRNFNRYINFGIPFKVAVAKIENERDNSTVVGADAILQVQAPILNESLIPYLFAGGGVVMEDFEDTNVQFPVGIGFNIRVGKNSYVNLQGEYRNSLADKRNNLQAGIGYIYRIGRARIDSDQDGIADSEDQCPDQPGTVELHGCPDSDGDGIADIDDRCPQTAGLAALFGCPDADGDGVADKDDLCPNEPGTVRGCPDRDGDGVADKDDLCPDQAGTLKGCPDSDGDGIADPDDACPTEAGIPEAKGCPFVDSDGDGVADNEDLCPDVPGAKSAKGCPDADGDGFGDHEDLCPNQAGTVFGCPDTDGDGVHDGIDKCLNDAGPASNQGCPEIKAEEREVLDLAMRAVQFETGKSTLKVESYSVLSQIVDILKRYPGYSCSINGHTDNVGSERTNQKLSEDRAKACYDYFLGNGISTDRLSYTGYGESSPIADNDTKDGRTMNRRTEFLLYIK